LELLYAPLVAGRFLIVVTAAHGLQSGVLLDLLGEMPLIVQRRCSYERFVRGARPNLS
jgi:hypothetical protein